MATELPVDVVELILSFLHSDIRALTACAQSHPTLSKLSKRYIYANVTLHDDLYRVETWTDFRISKFAQILAIKSDIAIHVRRLTLTWVDGNPGSEQHNAASSYFDGVATLLPMLVGLTALTLSGNFTNKKCIKWHSIPGTFRQALQHLIQHPHLSIKEVFIKQVAFFPMSLLNNRRNVRITLRDCEDTQYNKKSTNARNVFRSPPVPFEHLSIQRCSETCLRNIAPWVTVHGLRSLEYVDFSGDSLALFLVACSNSFTKLDLTIFDIQTYFSLPATRPNGDIRLFPFTLGSLCHLTQLAISTHTTYSDRWDGREGTWSMNSPIPAISELISTAHPALEKISVNISFCLDLKVNQRLPDLVAIWDPFIPLAANCSSTSISMHISPSFDSIGDIEAPGFFYWLADFKGLTPYVQNGVVIIEGC